MFAANKAYRISLPTACHENWQEMTPTEKGRFCASCQKEVIDFTQMNDEKIVQVLKRSEQGFCGRFRDTQLDRKIEKQKSFFGLSFIKKIAATFLAIISLKKGFAQGLPRIDLKTDSVPRILNQNKTLPITLPNDQAIVSGFVFDTDNKPLQNVEVEFSPYRVFAYTDSTGYFKMILDAQKLVDYTIIRFSFMEKSAVSRSIFKTNFPYETNIVMRRSGKEYYDYGSRGGAPIIYVEPAPSILEVIKQKIAPKKKVKKRK